MSSRNTQPPPTNGALVYRYYARPGGWRLVVLFHKGRKWIRVLETARLQAHWLRAADLTKLRPATDITPKRLAKRLRSRRALFRRLDVGFPAKAVARAIAALERK